MREEVNGARVPGGFGDYLFNRVETQGEKC